MKSRIFQALSTASLLPVAAGLLAGAIFIVDTITDSEIAIPAFYTAVVLMSVGFCKRRGVILVGLGCVGLTLLSDLLTAATRPTEAGVINTAISMTAIAATTYLVLKIESAKVAVYEARSQLAHVARITTLGEMTASIAHEVNQPLAATVTNGNACLRWLAAQPPNLDEARQAVDRIVKDANRASDIIARVRSLTKSARPENGWLNINEIIVDTLTLTETEIQQNRVSLQTMLAGDLPLVFGDRVQLQQVILNLIFNAIEAMSLVRDGLRELIVSTAMADARSVVISVSDTGAGLEPKNIGHIFDAFYSTKPDGMGMGLAISRSIVEAHRGRIWATSNSPDGSIFKLTLPIAGEEFTNMQAQLPSESPRVSPHPTVSDCEP
jgi:C4-dicarboxylate-specific signal transduction histidine kinase